ncbi:hypothetical protein AB4144_03150 [Rhizobiaceae sp. 2RAB30]
MELEAEARRDRIADTAESIRNKLSAGQLLDEFAHMFSGGDLSEGLGNLKAQVRDNPLPVTLIGAGLALLAIGGGSLSAGQGHSNTGPAQHARSPKRQPTRETKDHSGENKSGTSGLKSAAGSLTSTVGKTADDLASNAQQLRESMLTGVSKLKDRVSGSDAFEKEPLLLAALGLALGTAVGAMLPATEIEKDQLGPHVGKLRDEAEKFVDQGVRGAETVASKTYEALKEEADRQGITSSDESVAQRVDETVRSAAGAAEEAAREELDRGEAAKD